MNIEQLQEDYFINGLAIIPQAEFINPRSQLKLDEITAKFLRREMTLLTNTKRSPMTINAMAEKGEATHPDYKILCQATKQIQQVAAQIAKVTPGTPTYLINQYFVGGSIGWHDHERASTPNLVIGFDTTYTGGLFTYKNMRTKKFEKHIDITGENAVLIHPKTKHKVTAVKEGYRKTLVFLGI